MKIYFYIIILILFFSCRSNQDNISKIIKGNKNRKFELLIDTLQITTPFIKIADQGSFKIANTTVVEGKEYISISNFTDKSIYIYDLDIKKLVKRVELYLDGPNQTISNSYGFHHRLLNKSMILILNPFGREISLIDWDGKKVKTDKLPDDPDFNYVFVADFSIDGIILGNDYLYPAIPSNYMPINSKDPFYNKIKGLIRYNIKNGFKPMYLDRKNYYTYENYFLEDYACWTGMIAKLSENNFIYSDCSDNFIYSVNIESGQIKALAFNSSSFKDVPRFKFNSLEEYKERSSSSLDKIRRFNYTNPSYRQVFVDNSLNIIIRNTNLGRTTEDLSGDGTYNSSFIIADATTFNLLDEIMLPKTSIVGTNLADGVMSSKGILYFIHPWIIQDEDHLNFARIQFREK
jgi:hypothetical protein